MINYLLMIYCGQFNQKLMYGNPNQLFSQKNYFLTLGSTSQIYSKTTYKFKGCTSIVEKSLNCEIQHTPSFRHTVKIEPQDSFIKYNFWCISYLIKIKSNTLVYVFFEKLSKKSIFFHFSLILKFILLFKAHRMKHLKMYKRPRNTDYNSRNFDFFQNGFKLSI